MSIPAGPVRRMGRAREQQPERMTGGPAPNQETVRRSTMRVLVIVKANKDSEAGKMPTEQVLTEMGKFNEELSKAGVMLAGEGLHPSSKGVRIRFDGSK